MSETARALGLPGEIEWQGKPLTVGRVDFRVEGLFERFLEGRAWEGVVRNRSAVGEDAFRVAVRELEAATAVGEYAWTGDIARRAAWNDVGFAELSFLCLAAHQPQWTRQQHAGLLGDPVKYAELVRIIHMLSDPHPNSFAPADALAGASISP